MAVKVASQLLAEADRSLCGEILSRKSADKSDNGQPDKHHCHFENIRLVRIFDARVDYCRHYQRNKKLKARLKHFEQRRKDAFLDIMPQIL